MFLELKKQFFLDPKIIFLNHGSFGACAKPIYENLLYWQNLLEKEPVKFFEETIFEALVKSRKSLGSYINCDPNDLVYFPNPTTAVNTVARSLNLKPGDEILSTDHIYGALDRSWIYICKKKGVVFKKAKIPFPINSKEEFLDIFFSYVSDKTRVIFISHITSMTALKFPVEEIIKYSKDKNIITIIDGAHAPGHIPLDLIKLDADIYTGACHKWMCTPKGISFLYVKKELQECIHPIVISWGWESDNPGISNFLDWHEWQGTRDMSAFLTVPAAIDFLEKYNWEKISQTCRKIVIETRNSFLEYLDIKKPCPNSWLGQMASIPIPVENFETFKHILLKKYKIQVPIFKWQNQTILRYSIQGYNSSSDAEKLIYAVKDYLQ